MLNIFLVTYATEVMRANFGASVGLGVGVDF
jgi:hypothetical protein